jgi:hypothetical protein
MEFTFFQRLEHGLLRQTVVAFLVSVFEEDLGEEDFLWMP